jgi:hypothetical protein
VLIDPEGYVALQVSGEGHADRIAKAVDTLLAAHHAKGTLVRGPRAASMYPPVAPSGLRFPGGVTYDEARDLLAISDSGHHRIVLADAAGRVTAVIGSGVAGHADGSYATAAFQRPQGLCVWRSELWVADTGNGRLRRIDLNNRTVSTVTSPPLRSPWDVAPYADVLVVAMAGSHQLWALDADSGRLGPIVGSGREGLLDGALESAELAQPSGLARLGTRLGFVDAESSSLRALVPRDGDDLHVATAVGTGLFDWGDRDGVGPAGQLQHPLGLAAADHAWIVADTFNHRVRRYDPRDGRLTTLAGSSGGFADGPGPEARFDEPSAVTVVDGSAVVADTNNHVLRRIDLATGEVGTLMLPGLDPPGIPPRPVEPATLRAGSTVALIVALQPPPGTRVDPSVGPAPVRVAVTADPPSLLEAPAEHADRALPTRVEIATQQGSGRLRVEARGAFCEIDGGTCRLVEESWEIPVTLAADGLERLAVE